MNADPLVVWADRTAGAIGWDLDLTEVLGQLEAERIALRRRFEGTVDSWRASSVTCR
jgi:hypothetical protein